MKKTTFTDYATEEYCVTNRSLREDNLPTSEGQFDKEVQENSCNHDENAGVEFVKVFCPLKDQDSINGLSAYDRIPDGRTFDDELSYDILRGEDKIGENLIVVMGYGKRILLECGKALFPDEKTSAIEKMVVKEEYDAVVLTHSHEDHSGLLRRSIAATEIFMGETTLAILIAKGAICSENVEKVTIMKSEEPFFVGAIRFIPHLCDHSTADSYMIEVSDNEKTILYTGDFRSNGRKSFDALLRRLPEKVDLLICEKTTNSEKNETEKYLEEKAADIMKNHKEIFILQSAGNVDRLVSFYHACKKTSTQFLMTPLHAQILRHMEHVPNPKTFPDCFLYLPRNINIRVYENLKRKYGEKLIGRSQIAKKERFAMLISGAMTDYIKNLSVMRDLSNAILIYSLWSGYKDDMKKILSFMEDLGVKIVDLHVSGHADKASIDALISRTHPTKTIFVHTSLPSN